MPTKDLPGERFVVCAQNHDQIGNRPFGERLAHLAPGCEFAAAAVLLTAPAVPLLFMGEEHADPAPFLYYTDHGDTALQRAVSDGRRRELGWAGEVPDPQEKETFLRSRIDLSLGERGRHAEVRRFYSALLALRRTRPSLRSIEKSRTDARGDDRTATLVIRRWCEGDETLIVVSLCRATAQVEAPAPRRGRWRVLLDAADFGGAPVVSEARGRTLALSLGPLAAVVLEAQDESSHD
jgi:maltooligosyltrehalose trehalohydrolase